MKTKRATQTYRCKLCPGLIRPGELYAVLTKEYVDSKGNRAVETAKVHTWHKAVR